MRSTLAASGGTSRRKCVSAAPRGTVASDFAIEWSVPRTENACGGPIGTESTGQVGRRA